MHSIVETPDYLADARNAGLTEEERNQFIATLAVNPLAGDVIRAAPEVPGRYGFRAEERARAEGIASSHSMVETTFRYFCSTYLPRATGLICRRLNVISFLPNLRA